MPWGMAEAVGALNSREKRFSSPAAAQGRSATCCRTALVFPPGPVIWNDELTKGDQVERTSGTPTAGVMTGGCVGVVGGVMIGAGVATGVVPRRDRQRASAFWRAFRPRASAISTLANAAPSNNPPADLSNLLRETLMPSLTSRANPRAGNLHARHLRRPPRPALRGDPRRRRARAAAPPRRDRGRACDPGWADAVLARVPRAPGPCAAAGDPSPRARRAGPVRTLPGRARPGRRGRHALRGGLQLTS